jgi:hypothetical protein
MSEQIQTHWKKLYNPDFLGSYSLEPGKDMVLTIGTIKTEMVTSPDGKKEEQMVIRFIENAKPMILNATNAKTITKMYKTPYIEEWHGKKIQLFSEKVKAFGEIVEALRIRPTAPATKNISTKCEECKNDIIAFGKMTAEQMATYTINKYGKAICSECATKIKNQEETNNVTNE